MDLSRFRAESERWKSSSRSGRGGSWVCIRNRAGYSTSPATSIHLQLSRRVGLKSREDQGTRLGFSPSYWIAVLCWGLSSGLGILFNINTGSLRQAIVPSQMLGRIITIAMVLAWSANPIGAMAGGFAIDRTHDVQLVYVVIGTLTFLIPLYFRLFSPLGHAERYLPAPPQNRQGRTSDCIGD